MKKIKNFIKNNNGKTVSIKTIFGGSDPNRVSTFSQNTTPCGSTCQLMTTTDSFSDTNGNGRWDSGESGSSRTTVESCNPSPSQVEA